MDSGWGYRRWERRAFPARCSAVRPRPGGLRLPVDRRRPPPAPGALLPPARPPEAVPDFELTIAQENVALGEEEQHAGQEADRPQRHCRSLHLAGARAHFRARRRGCGARRRGRVRARRAGALLVGSASLRRRLSAPLLGGLSAADPWNWVELRPRSAGGGSDQMSLTPSLSTGSLGESCDAMWPAHFISAGPGSKESSSTGDR